MFPQQRVQTEDEQQQQQQQASTLTLTGGELDLLRLVRSDKATEDFFLKEISFNTVKNSILKQLQEEFRRINDDLVVKGSSLAGALSRALCFINRLEREKPIGTTLNSRILTFQVSPDIPTQYISIMNAIFSAQKMVCLYFFLLKSLLHDRM